MRTLVSFCFFVIYIHCFFSIFKNAMPDARRIGLAFGVFVTGFFFGVGVWATVIGCSPVDQNVSVVSGEFMATPYPLGAIFALVALLIHELCVPISCLRMRLYTVDSARRFQNRVEAGNSADPQM